MTIAEIEALQNDLRLMRENLNRIRARLGKGTAFASVAGATAGQRLLGGLESMATALAIAQQAVGGPQR